MELRHLKYFVSVAEEMNFTKAAAKLNMAQPPLSRQIKDLEDELGAPLFIRKSRNLALTEEGTVFLRYARQILSLADRSAEEVREIQSGLTGTLHFACTEGYGSGLFAKWIQGFTKLFPNIKYNILSGDCENVLDRIINGMCDFAIVFDFPASEEVHSLKVYEEPWVAIIPEKHPLSKSKPDSINLAELIDYDLIVPSMKNLAGEIRSWFDAAGIEKTPAIRCETAHIMSAYGLVAQGVGIAIFPESSVENGSHNGICCKKITNPSVTVSYSLIWSRNRDLSHLSRRFLQFVENNYTE